LIKKNLNNIILKIKATNIDCTYFTNVQKQKFIIILKKIVIKKVIKKYRSKYI